jgi:chromosome segregation ATPase
MEENVTVQQLSQALNQLLDAYENLQTKNDDLKKELEEAQTENEELKEQVSLLSSTTTEQTSEMDAMINRIESILSNAPVVESAAQQEPSSQTADLQEDTQDREETLPEFENSIEETTAENEPEKEEIKEETSKDQPDLGRMQALLNGFNN